MRKKGIVMNDAENRVLHKVDADFELLVKTIKEVSLEYSSNKWERRQWIL